MRFSDQLTAETNYGSLHVTSGSDYTEFHGTRKSNVYQADLLNDHREEE